MELYDVMRTTGAARRFTDDPLPDDVLDRGRDALLGLACGDALGTSLEFRAPGTFRPVTDIVGGGPFGLLAGVWTDDTSMALCLAEKPDLVSWLRAHRSNSSAMSGGGVRDT